ncbi:MAG: cytochrome c biogenesis CcdA family protein, partial [Patescibacteria group bacterium]
GEFILQNNLLSDFTQKQKELESIEKSKQEFFWATTLDHPYSSQFKVSDVAIPYTRSPLLLFILITFLAGIISFISPCSLPIVPAYLASTFKSSKHSIKGMEITFFLGLSIVFTLLGMSATLMGSFLKSYIGIFSQVAGIIIMIAGFLILFGKGFSGLHIMHKKPSSYLGSFLFGGAFALSWTPCIGPVLAAVLLLSSTTSSVYSGGILLFAFALGHAIPLFLLSAYIEKINKKGRVWTILKGKVLDYSFLNRKGSIHSSSLISGIIFIFLGYLMFSGIMYTFNRYASVTFIQKSTFTLQQWLLEKVK